MSEIKNFDRKVKGGFVNPSTLPRNKDNLPMCRWCSGGVLPPRRTFCSQNCAHEHMLRTNPSYLRQQCFERDNGICKSCGIDTKKIASELRKLEKRENPCKTGRRSKRKFILEPTEESIALRKTYNITVKRKVHLRKLGGGLWDADHILPVKDGGGSCGLNNIQTLCIDCHKTKTFRKGCKTSCSTKTQDAEPDLMSDEKSNDDNISNASHENDITELDDIGDNNNAMIDNAVIDNTVIDNAVIDNAVIDNAVIDVVDKLTEIEV